MVEGSRKTGIAVPIAYSTLVGCLFGLLIAVLLGGCQIAVTPKGATDGVYFQVGVNAIGEACHIISAPTDADVSQMKSAYRIYCGHWEQPSAEIQRTTDTGSVLELATRSWWREHLDTTVNCAPPVQTRILDEVSAAALDCTFRIGGWPYQALVTRIGDKVYFVESIPAAYPATERALGMLVGQLSLAQATQQASLSREIRRLEARRSGSSYSVGDLQHYRELLRLAQYYNFQGLFPEAEERYREALARYKEVLHGDRGGLGFLYMHIALQVSNQERFREADTLFDQAESLLQYSLEPSDEATLVSYRAIHLANQRQDNAALMLAHQATEMRRELAKQYGYTSSENIGTAPIFAAFEINVGKGGDVLGSRATTAIRDVVQSQSVEAAMLIEVGQLDEAEHVLAKASTLARKSIASRRWLPRILLLQARRAELRGNLAAAERLLTECIEAQQALFSKSRREGLAHLALGRVYATQGRLTEALDTYRTGFAIIAERGGGLMFDDVWPFFRAGLALVKRNPAQRDAINAEMFEVAQMIRGRVTALWMARTAARLATGDQEISVLIRDWEAGRRRRDELREQLTVAQADPNVLAPQIEELEKTWKMTNDRIAVLERQVQAAAPRYNQLVDMPVSADDVLGSLQPDEALVQTLLGTETSVVFFVDATGIKAYEIDITEQQAQAIVAKLRSPFESTDSLPEFPVADSHAFYVQLYSPVAERLAKADHIITVPTGPLLSLPFGLFVTEPPPKIVNRDYTQVAWMARHHALTLTPSVQSFVNLRQTVSPSRANQAFIGFGDFVPSRDADAILASLGLPESCKEQAILIANLPKLPGTGEEIRGIAELVGAPSDALFLGTAFSEDAVKQANLKDYRIVYFATHGLLPHKLNCLSQPALAMSKSAKNQSRGDGLLMTGEIIEELKLDADLVVLSACDTGGGMGGNETGGESLSGLARAFFYAGARSLLVSHWEVLDKPTMRLLTGTFERLTSQDVSLAEALRESQVALIEYRPLSHPLNWAGFTVVGDGRLRLSPRISTPTRVSDSETGYFQQAAR